MKYILLFFLLCFTTVMAVAEDNQLGEKLFNAKMSEFAVQLKLTPEQIEAFKPIYKQYQQEMFNVWVRKNKNRTKPANVTEDAAKLKRGLERQKRAQQIRIKYVDKFAKVCNVDQLMRLYITEDQIQAKLMRRRSHSKDGHHGKWSNR